MAVIEQPARKFVASLLTACVVIGSWWGLGSRSERPRQIAQEETSLIPYLCLSLIPKGGSWDQESIIFFVRINLGVILFLCCHK